MEEPGSQKGPETDVRKEIFTERHCGRRKQQYQHLWVCAHGCVWERKNTKDMLMHPAGMNLFEGLRFPHNRSLLSWSYTKSRSVLFLNNSQEYYRYGPRMLWRCSKWILMVNVTDADAAPGHGEVSRVWIMTFWMFRKTNVWIPLSLASWQKVSNMPSSSIT